MSISQVCIYIAVYILPALFLFGLACVVMSRQSRRLENRLVAAILTTYSIFFLIEFFRHLLPIEYSSPISGVVFSLIGLLIVGFSFHLYIHVANIQKRLHKFGYPFIFYLPLFLMLVVQVLLWGKLPSFIHEHKGIWYVPVFNGVYYTMLTFSGILNISMLVILLLGLRKAKNIQRHKMLHFLIGCTVLSLTIKIGLGYPNFGEYIPPYPFLYEGIVFSVFIAFSFLHNDLLPNISRRYRTLFDISPIPIIIVDGNLDILEINKQGRFLLNMSDSIDKNLLKYAQTDHNKNVVRRLIYELQQTGTLRDYPLALDNLFMDGILHFSIDAKYVVTGKERTYYAMLRDVTSEVEKEKMIMHMAYHDVLTDLHNRAFFVTHINKRLIELSRRPSIEAYFILLDLNHFKTINDSFGHNIGDQVLQYTAELLKDAVSERDLIARFGGDEFVLFLDNFPSREVFDAWLLRLRRTFSENKFTYNNIQIEITPSIGVSFCPDQGVTFEDLFHEADLNMYEDKESLKSRK
ncbi:diguanylate cyclase domain-containing protein [Psychrobacillus sp. NPDC093200]|uniref:diguanylate cyclase domain-containing protein n=1 Tax=Psychrobacillus sp. NPDC093200 TaxID=3390656 RepID=UPI003CFBD0C4